MDLKNKTKSKTVANSNAFQQEAPRQEAVWSNNHQRLIVTINTLQDFELHVNRYQHCGLRSDSLFLGEDDGSGPQLLRASRIDVKRFRLKGRSAASHTDAAVCLVITHGSDTQLLRI